MPTLVVNSRLHKYDVYIGRPSKWGNPFSHLPSVFDGHTVWPVKTREEAVRRYREWILTQKGLLAELYELKDKTLGCPGCNPDTQQCHGHVLAELADALP
jgi:hypothetical protein